VLGSILSRIGNEGRWCGGADTDGEGAAVEVEWKLKEPEAAAAADGAGPTAALLLALLNSGVPYSRAFAALPLVPTAEERRSWLRRNGVSSKA
jgi:hypothetical protein